ncbi:alpha/beta hydrolase [Nocardia stercoris]|uniref:Alpha/beta hydrolase n=1 Tax=Nocardia stercoris TaxID=2483361 RepID=A0A3M2L7H6_9NOCA|nr:alpha/beta hydrolase [Nocardia stercoris]RMI33642.1 alpha/beta hydrolase [Nocardia stercoris]
MSETTAVQRPRAPEFSAMKPEELIAYRDAENRWRASSAAWPLIGAPDPGAVIEWQELALPGRGLPVRVYRPASTSDGGADTRTGLPLVIHVHGGGYVGTAAQCDWTNSHLAVHLPALVVSVEHRLVGPDSTLGHAADDGWDVLEHVVRHAAQWGADPARTAVFGESFGGLISALTAIRARNAGLRLAAQVLVNPAVEVTETMYDYPSIAEYAYDPGPAVPVLRLLRGFAAPPGTDARALSPLYADDLSGLARALVVVPTQDALADHGRRYAERLRAAGTSVQLTEYPGARHAFLTLPGMEPQAELAQAEIREFLRAALAA